MRRFFKHSGFATVIAFVLVFALVESAVRTAHANLPVDPGKWPRIEIAQKLDRMDREISQQREVFDVVFVGSSVMAGGVDPVVFTRASGVSSFNAAWAGATARTSAAWVRNVVHPLAHPDVVVLGIQTGEMNDNGPKNQITYKKFVSAPGYKQTSRAMSARVTEWLEKLSYFVKFRLAFRTPTSVFNKDKGALERAKVRKEIGERGKRVEKPITYKFRKKFEVNFYDKNLLNFQLGGKEYRSLVKLSKALERRGTKLILIGTPVTEDYYPIHDDPRGAKIEFRGTLRRFQRETGSTVIDAIDAFPTSSPFRDPVHLDIEGRKPFSEALAARWSELATTSGGWYRMSCKGSVSPSCELR